MVHGPPRPVRHQTGRRARGRLLRCSDPRWIHRHFRRRDEWLSPFEGKGEDYGYAAFYASIDAVLLGRRTYEQCLTFREWPYPGKPCWVFSHGRMEITEPRVTWTDQNPHQMVRELQSRKLQRAWLVGGGELAVSFRRERLISEYIVSVVPVILGAGIPLFAAGRPQEALKLVETNAYPSGIVQLRYLRANA